MIFLGCNLNDHAKSSGDDDFLYLKEELGQKWRVLMQNMAYFKSKEDYEKPISEFQELGEKAYNSKLDNDYPDQVEIRRTNLFIRVFKSRNGKKLTRT